MFYVIYHIGESSLEIYFYSVFELLITMISPINPNNAPIHHSKESAGTANIRPNNKKANPTFCFFILNSPIISILFTTL